MSFRQSVVAMSTKVLDAIRSALPKNEHDLVLGIATAVEEEYRANAPRDTTSMAETVYVSMKDGVYQYGKRTSEDAVRLQAQTLNPNAKIIPLDTPADKSTAYIAPIVGHFAFNEYGTTKMPARPTMRNARSKVASELKSRHKHLFVKVVTGK